MKQKYSTICLLLILGTISCITSCIPSFNVSPTVIKEITIEDASIKWLGRSTAFAEVPDLITIEEDGQIDSVCIAQNIISISTCQNELTNNIKIGFSGSPMCYGEPINIPKTIGQYNIVVDTCYMKNPNTTPLQYIHGGILSKEVPTWNSLGNRTTPSKTEVQMAEEVLFSKIEYIKSMEPKYDYLISAHLDEYMRQYLGFVNEKGEKVIWINFVSEDSFMKCNTLDETIIFVLDGGSYYWSIYVNITTGTVYDMSVNGVA